MGKRYKDITLGQLRRVLNQAYKNRKGCKNIRVEFWLNDNVHLKLDRIGQFSVVPDVTISLKEFPKAGD